MKSRRPVPGVRYHFPWATMIRATASGDQVGDEKFSPLPRPSRHVGWFRSGLFHKPIVSDFPIVVDVLVAVPVRLLPAFPLFDFRGVLELLFGDVQLEAVGLFIVGQHRPGNRIVIRADAEEAAETQDRVGDPAGELVDHQALDLPDALTARVIDWHSLHPVACDQGMKFGALAPERVAPNNHGPPRRGPRSLAPSFPLVRFSGRS